MSVKIEPLVLAGSGRSLQTQETPNLQTVGAFSTADFVRARGGMSAATTDFITADIPVAGRARFIRSGGVGNIPLQTVYYPIAVLNNAVKGVAQFAQGRIISGSAVVQRVGPAVLVSGSGEVNPFRGYAICWTPDVPGNAQLRRLAETDGDTTLAVVAGWAVNDLMRIEVTPGTTGGTTHTVRVYRNGTLVHTEVDGNAARPPNGTGWPCWYIAQIQLPANSETQWSELSFGAGTIG